MWSRILVLTALALGAACEDKRTPTQPTPTTTEEFSGTLSRQSTSWHPFSVDEIGPMTVTLVTLDPALTDPVGLGLGTPSGPDCVLLLKNDTVLQGSILTASATTVGSYCVAIYDVGNLVDDTNYTISLIHR